MFVEKRARIIAAVTALSAALLGSWAAAQTQVFVDNFNNGSVANSDTQTNFWQPVVDGASTVVEPTGGPITLTAQSGGAGDSYPFAEIGTTSLVSAFNFFQQPIVLSASGLNYGAGSVNSSLTEFNFGSEVISQAGPVQTEYNEPSDFSLEILPPGNGDGQILMGEKANYPNSSTPWDSYQLIGPNGHVYSTQTLTGQVRSFQLVLSSQYFYLTVVSDTSPTNPAPVTTTLYGGLNLMNTGQYPWTTGTSYAPGDPSLNVETQIGGTSNTTDQAILNMSQLKVSQLPLVWTNGGGDGNWSNAANWSGLNGVISSAAATALNITVPDYASASATFPQASAPTTITIANSGGNTVTTGTININSTQPYTINGSILQFATNGSTGQMNVTAGNHSIDVGQINLYGNVAANIATGASLTLNSYLYTEVPTYTFTKTGGGTVNVETLQYFGAVSVTGGTLAVMPSPKANTAVDGSYINSLSITGGKLDLTNNDMVIDYTGSSPLTTVRGYLQTGALTSSDGSLANGTALGYAEATEINQTSSFYQIPTDSTSICIMYTYFGDLDLDGSVTGNDYTLMTNGNGSDWYNGDLNYDGVKNADDWSLFQIGAAESALRGDINGLPAPEPGSLAMLGAIGIGLMKRNRR